MLAAASPSKARELRLDKESDLLKLTVTKSLGERFWYKRFGCDPNDTKGP
jgi:hypothetical protein